MARCYEIEIGILNISEEKGVPLEHLISCVKGIGITSVAGHKRLQWSGKNDVVQDSGINCNNFRQTVILKLYTYYYTFRATSFIESVIAASDVSSLSRTS